MGSNPTPRIINVKRFPVGAGASTGFLTIPTSHLCLGVEASQALNDRAPGRRYGTVLSREHTVDYDQHFTGYSHSRFVPTSPFGDLLIEAPESFIVPAGVMRSLNQDPTQCSISLLYDCSMFDAVAGLSGGRRQSCSAYKFVGFWEAGYVDDLGGYNYGVVVDAG